MNASEVTWRYRANRFLDSLPVPTLGQLGRPVPTFLTCGIAGYRVAPADVALGEEDPERRRSVVTFLVAAGPIIRGLPQDPPVDGITLNAITPLLDADGDVRVQAIKNVFAEARRPKQHRSIIGKLSETAGSDSWIRDTRSTSSLR